MTQEDPMTPCHHPDCPRPAVWTVTARDSDGTAQAVVYACAWHDAQARMLAWREDRVQVVETRETKGEEQHENV